MSGRSRGLDNLWQCLCPSYASPISPRTVNRIALLSRKKTPTRCSSTSTVPSGQSQHPSPPHVPPTRLEAREPGFWALMRAKEKEKRLWETPAKRSKRIEEFEFSKLKNEPDSPELSSMSDEKLHRLLDYAKGRQWHPTVKFVIRHLLQERREKPALYHYNALLACNSSARHGSAAEVRLLLSDMRARRIETDLQTYLSAFEALAVHPDHLLQAEILSDMRDRWQNLHSNGHAFVAAGLIRGCLFEQALDYLQNLREKQVEVAPWTYDLLIFALLDANEIDKAAKILREREIDEGHDDIWPPVWKYLLERASYNVNYEVTLYAWRRQVEAQKLVPSDGTCEAVLIVACRAGDPELAMSVFNVLASRGTQFEEHHYESLIDANAYNGDFATAFSILKVMSRIFTPTGETTRRISELLVESPEHVREAWDFVKGQAVEEQKPPMAAFEVILEAAETLQLDDVVLEVCDAIAIGPDEFSPIPLPRGSEDATSQVMGEFNHNSSSAAEAKAKGPVTLEKTEEGGSDVFRAVSTGGKEDSTNGPSIIEKEREAKGRPDVTDPYIKKFVPPEGRS